MPQVDDDALQIILRYSTQNKDVSHRSVCCLWKQIIDDTVLNAEFLTSIDQMLDATTFKYDSRTKRKYAMRCHFQQDCTIEVKYVCGRCKTYVTNVGCCDACRGVKALHVVNLVGGPVIVAIMGLILCVSRHVKIFPYLNATLRCGARTRH